ncbi:MAG: 6,7-dimethyl-8-ribityllumazine synthase [Deltaproteobacteria bacterium]|nr:6,7-dimethyl-8-ribityllumazine synthase [Deltaproteobacteria bacterium]
MVGRFNSFITNRLLDGALDAIVRHGGDADKVTIVKTPGAFEIPLAAKKAAASGKYGAVIALGAGDPRRHAALRIRGGGGEPRRGAGFTTRVFP